MLTTCPQCHTKFNVPDQLYQPGKKARCSVCAHVFPLPEPQQGHSSDPSGQGEGGNNRDVSAASDFLTASSGRNDFSLEGDLPKHLHDGLVTAPGTANAAAGSADLGQDAGFGESAGISMMPPKPVQRKKSIYAAAVFVCVLALAVGVYFLFFAEHPRALDESKDIVAEEISDFDKIKNISLMGLKQYYVDNERMGPLVVIEGRARNDFEVPKSFITVEAQLYDTEGKVVAAQQQFCGVQLAPVQLSMLSKDDMVKALTNKFEIYATNVNVKPGGESPFMIVFMFPPTNIAKFAVRVVDAKDSPDPAAAGAQ